ncbi:SHIRT domain-containing protein, partial [uncultured Streptococcus sp.]
QPSQTEVKTAEGTWSFKSYDKTSETINGVDAHFVGTWEFTPAPIKDSGNTSQPEERSSQNQNLLPNTGSAVSGLLSIIGLAFASLAVFVLRKKD